ncbi:MFS transporter [Streptomyces litchfieldiae]|uniref:MFS transporter n=1 Tax=Streptomyces litchfieldiae TaxID=3075543 RepID=A0ABU2MYA8_9ACTN|nr:hypothetical protein [Streptomyces sp. DSM 44938]MDT0346258.1 hypothetical protein [Streptomyces sp. DSM 44938]
MATLRDPLPPSRSRSAPGEATGARPRLTAVRRDRVIVVTTAAFMLFNVAEGMLLLVVGPWLVKNELAGGAASLGVLIAAMAAGEFAGAALAGSGRAGPASVRRIGLCQVGAALAILPVLDVSRPVVVGVGFFGVGLLSAPMTVWAQSLRMRRIPPELHGRSFATLRTLMQGTPPLGTAMAAPLLVHGGLGASVLVMTGLAGLPGLYLWAAFRDAPENAGTRGVERTPPGGLTVRDGPPGAGPDTPGSRPIASIGRDPGDFLKIRPFEIRPFAWPAPRCARRSRTSC